MSLEGPTKVIIPSMQCASAAQGGGSCQQSLLPEAIAPSMQCCNVACGDDSSQNALLHLRFAL